MTVGEYRENEINITGGTSPERRPGTKQQSEDPRKPRAETPVTGTTD
jgi:hypothetical protein